MTRFVRASTALCVLVLALTALTFAQTSASLSGVVKDTTGAVVPGANVSLTDPSKNLKLDTISSDDGVFSFPTLQPGTYTVTVELTGFKQIVKSGIILQTNQKGDAGVFTMEVGEVSSTVQVTADAGQLTVKTRSGEQAEIVTGRQVRELAVNGRNYLDLVKIVPGVVSTGNFQVAGPGGLSSISINGTRTNQHNLTIDGATNVDTGSNGTQHVALNMDAIEEFQVLTSNYQAEYGRAGGGEIKITTRSGTKEYHGTGYLFHRHEGMNANNFFRNADNAQRGLYRYNYFGYNVGGPVKLPKGLLKDKLFFFWGQEWHKQLVPVGLQQVRMPTALEVQGDFSQTKDGNGNLITIKDPLTGQPFPDNKVPAARFNSSGQNILKLFNRYVNMDSKMPLFNHQSQESINYPRREENIRVDYNITDNVRMFARFTQDSDQQIMPYGVGWTSGQNFPLTPTDFRQGPARNASLNVTWVVSPTMTNEFVFGPSQNNLTLNPVDADAATMKGIGLTFAPPFPYSPYQFVNFEFGGTPNQNFGTINNYSQFPYKNSNTTFDLYDNFNKIYGSHSLKFGVYYQRSRKDQAAGDSMRMRFDNSANNPMNTGHAFANALMGNFDWLRSPNRTIGQGQYRSTNFEWYAQDNWKVSSKLTVDYGIRFSYIGPQYDDRDQERYFDPQSWDPAKAVRLFRRNKDGFAFDPLKPNELLGKHLVGRIVPGSGDPFNGMVHIRGGFDKRAPQIGPSVGFAYDVFGEAKTVIRGGFRTAYDRVSGNTSVFPAVGQPPVYLMPQFDYGNLDTVGTAGQVILGPSNVHSIDRTGKIPMVHSFSFQIQQQLPSDTVFSIGYVGSVSTHLWQTLNLNYSPYGELFTKAAQDPSRYTDGIVPDADPGIAQVYKDQGLKFDGSKAFDANYLKKYMGYGTIQYRGPMGSANYHSMQVLLQKRFGRGLTYAVSYTWGRAMDTANGDGDYQHPTNSRAYDYRRASFDRQHNLAINYVWNTPGVSKYFFDHAVGRAIFDNWQLSGISQFQTGAPAEFSFSIPNININQRIAGSWTEGPRLYLTGDPMANRRTRDNWYDWTAFKMPKPGDVGPWPRMFAENPGLNLHDISIYKNFPLWSEQERFLQFRLEMFNALNHAQFTGFNSGMAFNVKSDFSDFSAMQQASKTSLRNVRGGTSSPATGRTGRGTGEVNGQPGYVSAARVIQMAMKIYF